MLDVPESPVDNVSGFKTPLLLLAVLTELLPQVPDLALLGEELLLLEVELLLEVLNGISGLTQLLLQFVLFLTIQTVGVHQSID